MLSQPPNRERQQRAAPSLRGPGTGTRSSHALTSSSHALTSSSHVLTSSSHILTSSSHALTRPRHRRSDSFNESLQAQRARHRGGSEMTMMSLDALLKGKQPKVHDIYSPWALLCFAHLQSCFVLNPGVDCSCRNQRHSCLIFVLFNHLQLHSISGAFLSVYGMTHTECLASSFVNFLLLDTCLRSRFVGCLFVLIPLLAPKGGVGV